MQEGKQEVTKVIFLVQNDGKSTECIKPLNCPSGYDVNVLSLNGVCVTTRKLVWQNRLNTIYIFIYIDLALYLPKGKLPSLTTLHE